jgi:2-oxoglutarate ferredoxin oxidoreductase subunit gamma
VVSAARLLAECAAKTLHCTCLPEHGPEQRGGYSRCTVVISDGEILSPMPKKYDYVVAMDDPSAKKFAAQLEPGGLAILNAGLVPPAPGENRLFVPAETIAAELGSPRSFNIVLLGALLGAGDILPPALVEEALAEKFGAGPTLEALRKGIEIGKNHI